MGFNQKILDEEDEKLAEVLSKLSVKNLYLTSLGNSISAGYSFQHNSKPLLLRNVTLIEKMAEKNIETSIFHFARAQNNSDQHVDRWIETNLKLSDMHLYNLTDMHKPDTPYKNPNEAVKYYDLNPKFNPGLKDVITTTDNNMANIIIYNGGTGSFLDNITKNALPTILFLSIAPNTQIYLCGIPKLLGSKLIDIVVNNKFKKMAASYPNVTYVNPVESKLFYGNKPFSLPDYHYNEEEYLKFNFNIINQIASDYVYNKALIELDRLLFKTSETIEIEKYDFNNHEIENLIEKWYVTIDELGFDNKKFLQMLEKYFLQYYSSHYYYLDKKGLKLKIKTIKNT